MALGARLTRVPRCCHKSQRYSSMRTSLALIVAAFSALPLLAEDKPEWKEFTSKEGRFKVLMPGAPKQKDGETETDVGKIVLHMNTAEVGMVIYGTTYSDFPA